MKTHHHFVLETDRLQIRPLELTDFDAIAAALDGAFGEEEPQIRREWLEWQVSNYTALAALWQPPYGDRAITLKADGALIGAVGFVQSWGPFDMLPSFRQKLKEPPRDLSRPEFGLYWAVHPAHQGVGYATEAARAMVNYAFNELGLARIIATTDDDNLASQAVMRKLGMLVERNPNLTPEWFQVVGKLEHP